MECESLKKFKDFTDRNVLALQEAKARGTRVVGQYCIYSPTELALAARAIPVSLCGTKQDSIAAAEESLPRGLCPLIKSSYGFAVLDTCPYLAAADMVVADTTCDGKKKMFELLNAYKPVFMLQLPQVQDGDARNYWRGQFAKLRDHMRAEFDVAMTDEDLRKAIMLSNRLRRALKDVLDTAKLKPSPLSGMELLEISFRTAFVSDYETTISMLRELAAELRAKAAAGQCTVSSSAPRILLTGVPVGLGSHKVVQLFDACGASIVCLDACTGYKKVRQMMDEQADPLSEMADRYLDTPCSVMSPNPHRYTVLKELARDFAVDAVVDLTWQGCLTYDVESHSIKKMVREELHLPFLQLVTDYSTTDTEQLKVRVEAFLEMLH